MASSPYTQPQPQTPLAEARRASDNVELNQIYVRTLLDVIEDTFEKVQDEAKLAGLPDQLARERMRHWANRGCNLCGLAQELIERVRLSNEATLTFLYLAPAEAA